MTPQAHGKKTDGAHSAGDPVRARGGATGAVRCCAACRSESDPATMIRWVRSPMGEVAPDLGRSSFGRGAWLHADPRCLGKLNAALSRSFRAPVTTTAEQGLLLLR